jgi:hypothetical protein
MKHYPICGLRAAESNVKEAVGRVAEGSSNARNYTFRCTRECLNSRCDVKAVADITVDHEGKVQRKLWGAKGICCTREKEVDSGWYRW